MLPLIVVVGLAETIPVIASLWSHAAVLKGATQDIPCCDLKSLTE
jgi:hypothetical protein